MRHFNTAGPVVAEDHYSIPPLSRVDLDDVLGLIRAKKYFVLHAPRQTGKTSALLALQELLNSGSQGDYRCLYFTVEEGSVAGKSLDRAIGAVLAALASQAMWWLKDDFIQRNRREVLEQFGPEVALSEVLSRWAQADGRPLVLLIDEIDALTGEPLLSVLKQVRSGYPRRPRGFPQSVVLCGMRAVRDYLIDSDPGRKAVASPFNISAKSLRLGDFTRDEVAELLRQHTAETGQAFAPGALDRVWSQTQGQPWLVNALCDEACFQSERGRDRSREIVEADILQAQESLILRRVVHLDQLANKLTEGRVRRVVEPLLSGALEQRFSSLDIQYVRDLGLIAGSDPLRIANPIYAEVIPRELTNAAQNGMVHEPVSYVRADGGLDVAKLLQDFQEFFRRHSEHWIKRFAYQEAGPQLLLQAFLQRAVNGGGRIGREYGLGRLRTDLLILWPATDRTEEYVVECKILRGGLDRTVRDGVQQTAAYMDRCGAKEGHLVLFDRSDRSWKDKAFRRREISSVGPVHVWGM